MGGCDVLCGPSLSAAPARRLTLHVYSTTIWPKTQENAEIGMNRRLGVRKKIYILICYGFIAFLHIIYYNIEEYRRKGVERR